MKLKGEWTLAGKNIIKNCSFFANNNININTSSIKLPSAVDMIPLAKQYFQKKQKTSNKLLYLEIN